MGDLLQSMQISASGMRAQGERMKVLSQNMANASTAPTEPGADPYRRKTISFKGELDRASGVERVAVDKIQRDQSAFILKYDPNHPGADAKGYVKMPNVNPLIEAMDMREAQRSYEANLGSIEMSRAMVTRTIDLIRSNR